MEISKGITKIHTYYFIVMAPVNIFERTVLRLIANLNVTLLYLVYKFQGVSFFQQLLSNQCTAMHGDLFLVALQFMIYLRLPICISYSFQNVNFHGIKMKNKL